MYVEIQLHRPPEGRIEDVRSALHGQARRLKSEQGLRQVSVLEEKGGDLCLLAIWESRDTWTAARGGHSGEPQPPGPAFPEAEAPRVFLFEET